MNSKKRAKLERRTHNRERSIPRRPQAPLPMSSHPEADPAATRSLVTESDLQAYEQERRRAKPIVSINGEDVEQDQQSRRRVA